MKIPVIDEELCIGCGLCPEFCSAVFEMNDDDLAYVKNPKGCAEEQCCEEAVDECPVEAISMEENNG